MTALSLSQLVVVLQDNIQRSYEHAETLAVLDRGGAGDKITMALDRVEVELPIAAEFSEGKQLSAEILSEYEGASPYELAEARINLPTATPQLRRAMQDQIDLLRVRDVVKEQAVAEAGDGKQAEKAVAQRMESVDLDIAKTREVAAQELSRATAVTRNVMLRTLADDVQGLSVGKVTLQFKAALK